VAQEIATLTFLKPPIAVRQCLISHAGFTRCHGAAMVLPWEAVSRNAVGRL
jgi:hypothetical protein